LLIIWFSRVFCFKYIFLYDYCIVNL